MTGNGLYIPPVYGDDWRMIYVCFTNMSGNERMEIEETSKLQNYKNIREEWFWARKLQGGTDKHVATNLGM